MKRSWTRGLVLLPVILLATCGPVTQPPNTGGQHPQSPSPTATSPSPSASPTPSPSGPVVWWPLTGGSATVRPAITDVRVGTHEGYDRLVVEFTTGVPLYRLEANPWSTPSGGMMFSGGARGDVVVVQGSFGVQLRIENLDWFNNTCAHGRDLVVDYPTLKEVRLTGDFEAVVTLAIGLGRNVRPTVSILSGPPRLVIDFPA